MKMTPKCFKNPHEKRENWQHQRGDSIKTKMEEKRGKNVTYGRGMAVVAVTTAMDDGGLLDGGGGEGGGRRQGGVVVGGRKMKKGRDTRSFKNHRTK